MPPTSIGRYELVRRLGRGASGEVWEAWLQGPRGFRKEVALKRLRVELADPKDRDALVEEARLGALLHHPNVVGVHALEEHDGDWVVVMELVRGASLAELIRRGPLPARAVLELGLQVAHGLVHIHELRVGGRRAGLVHRDIKPSNLLIDRTGRVKIADLGVAGLAGERTVVGTPGFMPPEQWLGQADARADVFALGATVYACVTQRMPFDSEPLSAFALRRLLGDPALMAPVEAAIAGLGEVLQRCLAADPAERYPRPDDVADALGVLRLTHRDGPGLRSLVEALRPDLPTEETSTSAASLAATVVAVSGNLAPAPDAFFGRSDEVESLVSQVCGGARLVTLLGLGGAGKTRLGREVGYTLRSEFVGGVWFVDLSDARLSDEICAAVARVLEVRLDPADDPVAQMGHALSALGRGLWVLDNLEQCAETLPAVLERWLDVAPELQVIGTSRRRLGMAGEVGVAVGPLPTDAAVALFLDRSPTEIAAAHHAAVERIVVAVDGLALAVELAAARTRLVPVPLLEERLGLSLLSGGTASRPARHRSLQACLQWSWELLSPTGRVALAQLSVFEGAFDLRAAEAVLDLPASAGWALDALADLVDASLVQVAPSSGLFSLVRIVRAFAAGFVEGDGALYRHGAWFAQLGSGASVVDLDNLVAACRRAVDCGDGQVARGCALGAWSVLGRTGPMDLGLELISAARAGSLAADLALAAAHCAALLAVGRLDEAQQVGTDAVESGGGRAQDRGAVWLQLGRAAFQTGDLVRCEAALQQALSLVRQGGDRSAEGWVLTELGMVFAESGRSEMAAAHYDAALVAVRESGDLQLEGRALGYLGSLKQQLGALDEAEALFARSLRRARACSDHRHEAVVLGNLGIVARHRGQVDVARRHLEAALRVHRRTGNRVSQALIHTNIGNIDFQQGLLQRARARYEAGIALSEDLGDQRTLCVALGNLGQVLFELGDHALAEARLVRAVALAASRSDRRLHGHLLSELAPLRARRDVPGALQLLDRAEALVRQAADPGMLCGVLIRRTQVHRDAGDLPAAVLSLRHTRAALPPGRVDLGALVAALEASFGPAGPGLS